MTAATVPALAADLDAGLRRLKLAAMRRPPGRGRAAARHRSPASPR
jgi:hypothetical protein